ncbi:hypothetical protein [Acinetobacter sp. NigerLNRRAM0016]
MNISQLGEIATYLENSELDGITKECIDRLCCSRHYYHLFHIVCAWLHMKFNEMSECAGGGTHQALRTTCELLAEKFDDKDFKKLAMKLKQLHDIRVHADYRIEDSFSKHAVLLMTTEKHRVIELIEKLDNIHAKQTLKEA